MKYFVVAIVLAVVCSACALTDEQKKNAEKVGRECAVESALKIDEVQKIRTNPKGSFGDPKAQKFAKCLLTKVGFIDEKGEFQESVAIEKLSQGADKAKIEEYVKQCKSVLGPNQEENPLKLYACYVEKEALA